MTKQEQYITIGLGATLAITIAIVMAKKKATPKINMKVFDSPDQLGSGNCMDKRLIKMLWQLAKKAKYPVFQKINSGARTAYWNSKVGGVSNSAHKMPKCMAVDISTPTITIRNKIVVMAKLIGFKRIGVGRTFVHLDIDTSKRQNVAWGYPSGTKPPINPFI